MSLSQFDRTPEAVSHICSELENERRAAREGLT
jgi:hypothetical protein